MQGECRFCNAAVTQLAGRVEEVFVPSIQGTNGLVGAKYNQSDAENGKQAEQSYAKNRESNQFEHHT